MQTGLPPTLPGDDLASRLWSDVDAWPSALLSGITVDCALVWMDANVHRKIMDAAEKARRSSDLER